MDKVCVNGPDAHPAWTLAKEAFPGDVTWNFAGIFLFDGDGTWQSQMTSERYDGQFRKNVRQGQGRCLSKTKASLTQRLAVYLL